MILAIKGHSTRGSEVITLLEMLGGINNRFKLDGLSERYIYYICPECNNDIHSAIIPTNQIVFSLEEFEEKFPYKIGDKVKTRYGIIGIIARLVWDSKDDDIRYELVGDVCSLYFTNELQPYKEETMNRKYNVEEYLKVWEETGKGLEVVVNDNFELKEDNGKFYIIKKQPKYPKTYEECCDILKIPNDERYIDVDVPLDYNKLLSAFTKLLICRNAYWKIAGEEMKLDKPWEPDFTANIFYPSITVEYDEVVRRESKCRNVILVFPTSEMCNFFYENFKNSIKQCRKLL